MAKRRAGDPAACRARASSLLPSGTPGQSNPADLLATSALRDLLASLRARYDDVVLDTPAGRRHRRRADPRSSGGRRAGGRAVRARWRRATSLHVLERLVNARAFVLGVVLNRRPRRRRATTTGPPPSARGHFATRSAVGCLPSERRASRNLAGEAPLKPAVAGRCSPSSSWPRRLGCEKLPAAPDLPNEPPTAAFFYTPVAPDLRRADPGGPSTPSGTRRRRRPGRLLRLELRRRHARGDDAPTRHVRTPFPDTAARCLERHLRRHAGRRRRQGRPRASPPRAVTVTELPAPTAQECAGDEGHAPPSPRGARLALASLCAAAAERPGEEAAGRHHFGPLYVTPPPPAEGRGGRHQRLPDPARTPSEDDGRVLGPRLDGDLILAAAAASRASASSRSTTSAREGEERSTDFYGDGRAELDAGP